MRLLSLVTLLTAALEAGCATAPHEVRCTVVAWEAPQEVPVRWEPARPLPVSLAQAAPLVVKVAEPVEVKTATVLPVVVTNPSIGVTVLNDPLNVKSNAPPAAAQCKLETQTSELAPGAPARISTGGTVQQILLSPASARLTGWIIEPSKVPLPQPEVSDSERCGFGRPMATPLGLVGGPTTIAVPTKSWLCAWPDSDGHGKVSVTVTVCR